MNAFLDIWLHVVHRGFQIDAFTHCAHKRGRAHRCDRLAECGTYGRSCCVPGLFPPSRGLFPPSAGPWVTTTCISRDRPRLDPRRHPRLSFPARPVAATKV